MSRVRIMLAAWLLGGVFEPARPQAMPVSLRGQWRIVRILPTRNVSCWDQKQADTLLGTTLSYAPGTMGWKGGEVPVSDVLSRTVTRADFRDDTNVDLVELGIRSATATEIDLQHEDADITGATTEVPGDVVLLAGPGTIVVSACGVYYRAVRVMPAAARGRR